MCNGTEIKVGVIFLLSLLLLGVAIYFLLGYGLTRDRYTLYIVYDQAQLQRGDEVRLAGVLVGEVSAVRLTPENRAEVTVRLNRGVQVHQNDYVTIGTGALLGENYVEIQPAPAATNGPVVPAYATLVGHTKPQLEDLITASQGLVLNLQTTVSSLNRIINDPQNLALLRQTLANFSRLSMQSERLVLTMNQTATESRPQIAAIAGNLAESSRQIRLLVTDLSAGLRESDLPTQVSETVSNLRSVTERVDDIVAELQSISKEPALRENVLATADNIRAASARLTTIADTIERAAQNIESTSRNFETASENVVGASGEAREAAARVNQFIGKATGAGPGKLKLNLPRVSGRVDLQYLPRDSRWWTEANLDLALGGRLLRAGVADIGEGNKLNLQAGLLQGDRRLRLGVIQAKPGLGYDWPLWGADWSLDLFDPNDPRFNLLSAWPVGDGYSVTAGVRNALQHPEAAVGVRLGR